MTISGRFVVNAISVYSKFIKKWLGVPNSLTNVALYCSSTKLKLPTLSFVEEYELGKAWLFQMLRDSRDPLVKNVQPSMITGRKRKAKIGVENAESALRMKRIIGTVANGKAGLGLHPQCWWSKESMLNWRKMASGEIHHLEEVRRFIIAVGHRKQRHGLSGRMQKTELSHGETLSTWNQSNLVSSLKQSTTFYQHQSTIMLGG